MESLLPALCLCYRHLQTPQQHSSAGIFRAGHSRAQLSCGVATAALQAAQHSAPLCPAAPGLLTGQQCRCWALAAGSQMQLFSCQSPRSLQLRVRGGPRELGAEQQPRMVLLGGARRTLCCALPHQGCPHAMGNTEPCSGLGLCSASRASQGKEASSTLGWLSSGLNHTGGTSAWPAGHEPLLADCTPGGA